AAAVEILGIALAESEELDRQTEPIGRDLRVGRLVTLAVGMRADADVDVIVVADLESRHLVGRAARGLEETGVAEASQPPPLARLALARVEAVRRLDGEIDRVAKAALLDRKSHRRAMRKAADDVLAPQLHG